MKSYEKKYRLIINYYIYFNNNKKEIIKIIFLLLVYLNYVILKNKFKKKNINIKICICTVGKNENRYIKEYVEYYKNYGIDKIFLYDNNNIDGEKFEEIINEYVIQNFVEIINWRGIQSPQMMIYNDCYNNNYNKYDWLIFNDIDEYIYLKNYNNIKIFLNKPRFNKCEKIQLNWVLFTDNNYISYENKSLLEKFIEIDPYVKIRKIDKNSNGKSILRGHIPNIKIVNFHSISDELKSCDSFGHIVNNIKRDYKYYYFKHYYCKSTEEFIEKLKKGDVYQGNIPVKIATYFNYNKITYQKINLIEKNVGVNLTYYKNIIAISKKKN